MSPIYLLTGNSYMKIKEEIQAIVGNFPYSTYDLLVDELDDVLEEASYVSLFDEQKYMVVKNAHVFGTEKRISKSLQTLLEKDSSLLNEEERERVEKYQNKNKKLLAYLENPNPKTCLIFCLYGKSDSKKKNVKLIKEKYTLKDFPDLKGKELRTILEHTLKENGYRIDYNVGTYILNSCQNNYDLLLQEIEKIKLYYGKGCTIPFSDITKIVSRNLENSNFKFIDAVMSKDMKEAFSIYDDLMLQKVEPMLLLSLLAKEVRNTLLVKQLMKEKSKNELMDLLQIRYDFQIDKIMANTNRFSISSLEQAILLLSSLDYKIKTGRITNKLALQLFLLKICQ